MKPTSCDRRNFLLSQRRKRKEREDVALPLGFPDSQEEEEKKVERSSVEVATVLLPTYCPLRPRRRSFLIATPVPVAFLFHLSFLIHFLSSRSSLSIPRPQKKKQEEEKKKEKRREDDENGENDY